MNNSQFKKIHNKENKISVQRQTDYWKNFKVSTIFGLIFGIVFLVVTLITKDYRGLDIYIIPIICAVISGLAGLLATYLENFFINRGIENALIRKTIIFSVVITLQLL